MCILAGCTSAQQLPLRERESPPIEEPKPEPLVLPETLFTTISEIRKLPLLFDGQTVRVKGTATRVQLPPRSDKAPTIFDMLEDGGETLRVKTAERVAVDDGSIVTVEGRISVGDPMAPAPAYVEITEAKIIATELKEKAPVQPNKPKAKPPVMLEELLRAEELLPEVPLPDPASTTESEVEDLLPEVPLPDPTPTPEPDKGRVF